MGKISNSPDMTLKEFFDRDRFAAMIGAELIEIRQGYARARMLVTSERMPLP